ncbi:hypothetical protein UY3_05412 [Chelonia mydas]|uniref:Uncharacterized protein n=1 Tax=Chelonia mydas TaxID=8469 RepID=M7BHR3_CHEMY|nr:hypothetical protein UY3_05412 [Chelonia mydas]
MGQAVWKGWLGDTDPSPTPSDQDPTPSRGPYQSTADTPPPTASMLLALVEYRSQRESTRWSIYRVFTRHDKVTPPLLDRSLQRQVTTRRSAAPSRRSARIQGKNPTPVDWAGTSCLISQHHFATAAHALLDKNATGPLPLIDDRHLQAWISEVRHLEAEFEQPESRAIRGAQHGAARIRDALREQFEAEIMFCALHGREVQWFQC